MKKKKIGIIALVLIFTISLTACSNGNEFTKALIKQQEITSARSDMQITLNVDGEGFGPEKELEMAMIKGMFNGLIFDIEQTSISNRNRDKIQSELSLTTRGLQGGNTSKIWLDIDNTSKDKGNMKQIYKLDKNTLAMLGVPGNKEYLVYDLNKLQELSGHNDQEMLEESMKSLMNWSTKLEDRLSRALSDYIKNYKLKVKLVDRKEKKIVDKESLKIYELNMNDKEFKEFLRYTGNEGLNNKEIYSLYKEYLEILIDFTNGDASEKARAKEEIGKAEDLKVKLNEALDKLDGIKIIGDKGINIKYGINKDGYISYEEGKLDLVLDLENIGKIFREEVESKGRFKFIINYEVKLKEINNKNLKLEMPKLDESNSLDFVDLIKAQEGFIEQQTNLE